MAKNPTNNDIILAISTLSTTVGAIQQENKSQHEENTKRFDVIEKQVKYTNGRVTRMEEKWSRAEAVEEYKAKQGAQSGSDPKALSDQGWFKLVLVLASIIAALVGAAQIK